MVVIGALRFHKDTTESDSHCDVLDRPFIHRPAWCYIQPALNINPRAMVLS